MRFFLDNNLSYRLADALASLSSADGDVVVHIRKKFDPDPGDLTWIPRLSAEGDWIVVSGDCKIRSKPTERKVFFEAKLVTFFLAPGWINCKLWEQAALLIHWWPRIKAQALLAEAPAVIEIPFRRSGGFKLLPPPR